MVSTGVSVAEEGLRARKRRETRQRIAEAGFRLFVQHGFEAVTLDAIAAEADISRRTFFHYFDSKEDILLAWESEAEAAFVEAVAAEPEGRSPLEIVQEGLAKTISRYESDQSIAIDRLLRSNEALCARKQGSYERKERALFAYLIERWPDPDRRRGLRLTAMLGVSALRLAVEEWSAEDGRRPLVGYFNEMFDILRGQLAGEGA
ncbi:MAG: helix-turn-helix domain-containing protein [Caulobacteraceae bacterium]